MKHDYVAALEWFERKNRGMTIYEDHPYIVIVHALKMMQKLEDPSDVMLQEGAFKRDLDAVKMPSMHRIFIKTMNSR